VKAVCPKCKEKIRLEVTVYDENLTRIIETSDSDGSAFEKNADENYFRRIDHFREKFGRNVFTRLGKLLDEICSHCFLFRISIEDEESISLKIGREGRIYLTPPKHDSTDPFNIQIHISYAPEFAYFFFSYSQEQSNFKAKLRGSLPGEAEMEELKSKMTNLKMVLEERELFILLQLADYHTVKWGSSGSMEERIETALRTARSNVVN